MLTGGVEICVDMSVSWRETQPVLKRGALLWVVPLLGEGEPMPRVDARRRDSEASLESMLHASRCVSVFRKRLLWVRRERTSTKC